MLVVWGGVLVGDGGGALVLGHVGIYQQIISCQLSG